MIKIGVLIDAIDFLFIDCSYTDRHFLLLYAEAMLNLLGYYDNYFLCFRIYWNNNELYCNNCYVFHNHVFQRQVTDK